MKVCTFKMRTEAEKRVRCDRKLHRNNFQWRSDAATDSATKLNLLRSKSSNANEAQARPHTLQKPNWQFIFRVSTSVVWLSFGSRFMQRQQVNEFVNICAKDQQIWCGRERATCHVQLFILFIDGGYWIELAVMLYAHNSAMRASKGNVIVVSFVWTLYIHAVATLCGWMLNEQKKNVLDAQRQQFFFLFSFFQFPPGENTGRHRQLTSCARKRNLVSSTASFFVVNVLSRRDVRRTDCALCQRRRQMKWK